MIHSTPGGLRETIDCWPAVSERLNKESRRVLDGLAEDQRPAPTRL
jgi:hypothetical protein